MPHVSETIDKFLRSQALSAGEKTTLRTSIGAPSALNTISGGGLVIGGGTLDDNRTLTVQAATRSDTAAGAAANMAVTPYSNLLRWHNDSGIITGNGAYQDLTYQPLYTGATILGIDATGEADFASVYGYKAMSLWSRCIAIGSQAYSSAYSATAIGYGAYGMGVHGIAIGESAHSQGDGGMAVGAYTYAGMASTAFGYGATASQYSAAFGYMSETNQNGVALGAYTSATGVGSVAMGPGANTSFQGDIEIASQYYYNYICRLNGSSATGGWFMTYGRTDPTTVATTATDLLKNNSQDLPSGMMTFVVDTATATLKTVVNINGTEYTHSQVLSGGG